MVETKKIEETSKKIYEGTIYDYIEDEEMLATKIIYDGKNDLMMVMITDKKTGRKYFAYCYQDGKINVEIYETKRIN